MLSLSEIEKYYPDQEKAFKRNILREYLQYKILEIIFNSPFQKKLSFLGGTSIRIIYGSVRFSEDLDFDNFGLEKKEFEDISRIVKKELELEGYLVEVRNIFKGAYRCYVKIPKLLFDNSLSGYEEEKILIQLDTLAHGFSYTSEKTIINKFDVFTEINTTPIDVVLSQKIYAIFERKRKKGRDFYDVIFLLSKTKPNYSYLELKMGISNADNLRKRMLSFCKDINLEELSRDVRPFLVDPKDFKKITLFEKYFQTVEL